ncbi:MAG: hypothetical protein UV37_C0017G0022 [Candidatus Collierbacteria bacterium GW2011_GWA1_42_60]|nr:MAG: hypothetical protein UV37_C0017G0022 [Candidatus Collierbacteria bacterium GW2011_GWA1_42_60]
MVFRGLSTLNSPDQALNKPTVTGPDLYVFNKVRSFCSLMLIAIEGLQSSTNFTGNVESTILTRPLFSSSCISAHRSSHSGTATGPLRT